MHPKTARTASESGIPALYTYFGQFVDHDITFDPASRLQKQNDPDALVDFRTRAFDLDNVYGGGPDDQPYMYDANGNFLLRTPLTGGKEPQATLDITEGGQVVSPNENNRRAAALRAMVGTVPEAGTNTLIVTHKPNILDALGRDWFEIREGEASIFKPTGDGKYVLVGRVQINQWTAVK